MVSAGTQQLDLGPADAEGRGLDAREASQEAPAAGWAPQAEEPGPPTIRLHPDAKAAGDACVQCGLCLPACPTYLETGNEADGPRGRIRLMLGLHDGDVPHTPAAQKHLDGCLGCLACASACPSGVDYGTLLENTRDQLGAKPDQQPLSRLQRILFFQLLARPNRLRVALAATRIGDRLGLRRIARRLGVMKLMPETLRRMDGLLPIDDTATIWPSPLPPHSRAGGVDMLVEMLDAGRVEDSEKVQTVVAFFEGCVAATMMPKVHRMAAELMCAAGADVVSPPAQVCCGAIHRHAGEAEKARELARQNLATYLGHGVDLRAIVTCTAGDGAMLRNYEHLLADDPQHAADAREFASLVRDITETLLDLDVGGDRLPLRHDLSTRTGQPLRAAYHDACHLAHAQGVRTPPRELLGRVPGLELVDLPESDVCCGAAGTYNLTQPEMATKLAHRKLDRFAETNADVLVSGNIGCTTHLRAAAVERKMPIKIVHPVELVHAAAFGQG
jgi:glycolate oxidase iron-sulfur subunit